MKEIKLDGLKYTKRDAPNLTQYEMSYLSSNEFSMICPLLISKNTNVYKLFTVNLEQSTDAFYLNFNVYYVSSGFLAETPQINIGFGYGKRNDFSGIELITSQATNNVFYTKDGTTFSLYVRAEKNFEMRIGILLFSAPTKSNYTVNRFGLCEELDVLNPIYAICKTDTINYLKYAYSYGKTYYTNLVQVNTSVISNDSVGAPISFILEVTETPCHQGTSGLSTVKLGYFKALVYINLKNRAYRFTALECVNMNLENFFFVNDNNVFKCYVKNDNNKVISVSTKNVSAVKNILSIGNTYLEQEPTLEKIPFVLEVSDEVKNLQQIVAELQKSISTLSLKE